MSFAEIFNSIPPGDSKKPNKTITGGVLISKQNNIVPKIYTPPIGKGSEYAAKYKAEDDRAYFESMSASGHIPRGMDVMSGEESLLLEKGSSIGTLPNMLDVDKEKLTEVYQHYSSSQPASEIPDQLKPIHKERNQILSMIELNQVCIITGSTGCGKSTQIPQFILDEHMKRGTHCNIVVTQPRRIAAIAIAQHVSMQRHWEVGGIVGYQVGLDRVTSDDTRLLYCTTGVLLEKLIGAKHMNDYTHILLDEVHEREEDMDFVILIVKRMLRTNSPNVKVVLMSATMDVTRFAKYFEVTLVNERQLAPFYEIKNESKFDVKKYFLDAVRNSLGEFPRTNKDEPNISKKLYELIPILIRSFDEIDKASMKDEDEKGAVLIFLPGLYQIETLYDLLATIEGKNPNMTKLWLCPLHSSITKDEQEKVRKYAPKGKRKIILSTNIAESSITIPDVKYVIDFCLTKHLVADPNTGFSSLQLTWASQTNCIQREGRVGRVQDGRVYKLVDRDFYVTMPTDSVPEMQRCPLDIIILKSKRLMEDMCPLELIACAMDPPDLSNYEKTVLKLKEIGALLTTCKGLKDAQDGDLTFFGKVMSCLPLDIHITKLILLGHVFGVLEEAIIMGCAMSVRNIFSEPFGQRLKAYNNKLLWADSSESDSIAYLNAYKLWRHWTGLGKFERSRSSEEAWARRILLQIRHLREVAKLETEVIKRLKTFNIENIKKSKDQLWMSEEKPLILKIVLAGAFYPHYFLRSAPNPNVETEAIKTLSGYDPYSCVYLQNMAQPAPLYLDQVRACLKENGVSDIMQLHCTDSSKLIVQFGQQYREEETTGAIGDLNANIPGDILMPVYRAVKLRQLKIPIVIKTFSQKEVKEVVSRLSLQSRTSMMSMEDPTEQMLEIGLTQQIIEIEVTHVENAGHFHCQILPKNEKIYNFHRMMNQNRLRCVTGNILDNFVYAAPYREADIEIWYYRAKVKRQYTKNNKHYVNVLFIDYGNSADILSSELRELVSEEAQQELEKYPPFALNCVLAEVCPSVWSGQWCDEANKFVTKTILNRNWVVEVYSYVCGVASVNLFLSDNIRPSESKPHTLNEELVRRGWARTKEEGFFSKQNHNIRVEHQQSGKYEDHSVGDSSKLFKSPSRDLMCLPTTNISQVHLKGPHSPLEMRLLSMTFCSTTKEVRVETNSVNSVLLDVNPSDPHDRLLVAGSVSQSPDGHLFTLNQTTVLPNLNGLAALICVIFAPTIELRTDEYFSRFTGALCGLGMNEYGLPLFTENDMEIKFDVEFTTQDLENVNKLRYWMSNRFCSEDPESMQDVEIIDIQHHIRDLIKSLIQTSLKRNSVRVHHTSQPYTWGLVKKERIRPPIFKNSIHDTSNYIYNLHCSIDLDPTNGRYEIERLVNAMKTLEESLQLQFGSDVRKLYCELCDTHFGYVSQLRQHMTSTYHRQLMKWLQSRAKEVGLVDEEKKS